jgi:hippurate hydrolase
MMANTRSQGVRRSGDAKEVGKFISVIALLIAAPLSCQTPAEIDTYYPELQTLYQDLHRNPELAFQEVQTAGEAGAHAQDVRYEVTTASAAPASSAAEKRRGPTVMLRTELDALPVAEKTGAPFASTVVTKNLAAQPCRSCTRAATTCT